MKTLAAILFFTLMLYSCSSVHKVQDQYRMHIDSSKISRSDSIVKKHIDTSKNHIAFTDHSSTLEIDLDTSDINLQPSGTSTIYKGYITQPDYIVQFNKETGTIHSTQPIHKVIFKQRAESVHSNFTGGVDTSLIQVSKEDSAYKKKDEIEIHRTVDRKGMTLIQKVGLVIGAILTIALFFFIAYLKKKKKTVSDVLTAAKDII